VECSFIVSVTSWKRRGFIGDSIQERKGSDWGGAWLPVEEGVGRTTGGAW
jgi:hypothetical protein